MESFWDSCEARGPLILEVEGEGDSRPIRHVFDRPFLVIGSGPRSDLVLDHRDVSRRHAYLQMIAGRPFCVDLESRTGTHLEKGTADGGWVAADRPIRIGPYSLRVILDEEMSEDRPTAASNPLAGRSDGSDLWPPTSLEVKHPDGPATIPIARTLSLIGRSSRCKIRLETSRASRFHGALLRTPGGAWVVDLSLAGDLSVNGARRNHAKLRAGDELRVGPFVARVGEPAMPPRKGRLPATVSGSTEKQTMDRPLEPAAGDFQAILEQVADLQQHSNDQFRQAIVMVTQLFGSMHRETIDLVREELEQVRNLAGELKVLREEMGPGATRPPDSASNRVAAPGTPPGRSAEDGPGPPRDPGVIHLIVSERLAVFEQERRGRWNKLSRILSKANP